MKVQAYAVRDGKVEQFFPPICHQTPGAAQRWFGDIVNNPQSEFHRHPGDYALYHVGTFDTETGGVSPVTVALVVTGLDVFEGEVKPEKLEVSHG